MSSCFECLGGCVAIALGSYSASRFISSGSPTSSPTDRKEFDSAALEPAAPEGQPQHGSSSSSRAAAGAADANCCQPSFPESDEDLEAAARRKLLAKLGGDASKALYEAAQWGDFGMAFDALDVGADPLAAYGTRRLTTLHVLAQTGNVEVLSLILRQPNCTVDVRNRDGETALMNAVRRCNAQAAELLVESRADVNARDEAGRTSLDRAKELENGEFVAFLTRHGAQ